MYVCVSVCVCVWLLSLSIMFLRSSMLFLFSDLVFHCTNTPHFVYPSVMDIRVDYTSGLQ